MPLKFLPKKATLQYYLYYFKYFHTKITKLVICAIIRQQPFFWVGNNSVFFLHFNALFWPEI